MISLVALLASAAAGDGATSTLVAAEPGDSFSIQGTDFQCGVPTSGAITMVCYLGTATAVLAHSYATATSDQGAVIFTATGTRKIVANKKSATVSGPLIAGPGHVVSHYTLSRSERVAVTGSHIFCASGVDNAGRPTFACGLLSSSEHSYWVPGTYGSVISNVGAYLLLAGKGGSHTSAAFKPQP